MNLNTKGNTKEKVDLSTFLGKPHNVILFNDDEHSFDQVIRQLIKALRCSAEEASAFAQEAHTKSEAVVLSGNLERCEHVDRILSGAPAKLRTDIQEA